MLIEYKQGKESKEKVVGADGFLRESEHAPGTKCHSGSGTNSLGNCPVFGVYIIKHQIEERSKRGKGGPPEGPAGVSQREDKAELFEQGKEYLRIEHALSYSWL